MILHLDMYVANLDTYPQVFYPQQSGRGCETLIEALKTVGGIAKFTIMDPYRIEFVFGELFDIDLIKENITNLIHYRLHWTGECVEKI